jgi:hypothetical protein
MTNANAIISDFKGVYARVAGKLNVSASMVSRVARGERRSQQIERALLEEINAVKQRLESCSAPSPGILNFPEESSTSAVAQSTRPKNFRNVQRSLRSATR